MKLFEVKDKSGRTIHLTKERWKHIVSEHPVVADKIENIKETLIHPLALRKSNFDSKVRFYYR